MEDMAANPAAWYDNDQLKTDLKELVHSNYTNKEIVALMETRYPEYRWSLATLKRRLQTFSVKRIDKNIHPNELLDALREELAGPGQCLGYQAMHKKIREVHKLLVSRNDVYLGMKMLCPSKLQQRNICNNRKKFHKRVFISKGPNFVWRYDGHDKLCGKNKHEFPFGIHAGIDCFSRKVIWIKVWPSNSCPILPGKLFLDAVESLGIHPDFTRSDKGTETVLIAPMQMFLCGSNDGHIYGSSTTNQVIERWWRGCREMQGDYFKNKLVELKRDGQYFSERNTCRVLLAFVYMGLIQKSLDDFVAYWNNHRIRKQDIRRPCGVVNYLYECPEVNGGEQCGKQPDPEKIRDLRTRVEGLQNLKFLSEDDERTFENYLAESGMLPVTCHNANECYRMLYEQFHQNAYNFSYS